MQLHVQSVRLHMNWMVMSFVLHVEIASSSTGNKWCAVIALGTAKSVRVLMTVLNVKNHLSL